MHYGHFISYNDIYLKRFQQSQILTVHFDDSIILTHSGILVLGIEPDSSSFILGHQECYLYYLMSLNALIP